MGGGGGEGGGGFTIRLGQLQGGRYGLRCPRLRLCKRKATSVGKKSSEFFLL